MEFDAVTTKQLAELANSEDTLRKHFAGVYAADTLPKNPGRSTARGYIVNTDPHSKPGRHWIALWTEGDICQVMDSYGLPLAAHQVPQLQTWLRTHWPLLESNTSSLQAINSATCGHYALRFLIDRSRGKTMRQFLELFDPYDYVYNDALIARWMKHKILHYVHPVQAGEELIYLK